MAWDLKAVEAATSAQKTALEDIPEDVIKGVEEAYEYCLANPGERLVVTFETAELRDLNRALVRNYCEQRKEGRITASIWAISVDPETGSVSKEDGSVPALSMWFKEYVKREKSGK